MTNPASQEVRVLLPANPEDDLQDVFRVLRAVLPASVTHVRRLYIHRPVEADFYIPETYSRYREIARLESDAENATRVETEREMKPFAEEGYRVSADVIRGMPTEEILREASSWRADLVGVRTRSLAADDRRIGGMASALLHHAACPVLTHHRVPEDFRLRRILIPTDFSEASRQSVEWALALAELTRAEPILLHVIARRAYRHGVSPDDLLPIAMSELERWHARLDPVAPGLIREARVTAAETPAEGILAFARERGCDLIAVSATGVSAVRAILLGSNTRRIVRASAIPVLVIPSSNRVAAETFLAKARGAAREVPKSAARAAGAGPAVATDVAPRFVTAAAMPARQEEAGDGTRFQRILVATDFSEASAPAVRKAIALARDSGAELTIAHAYQPPSLLLDGYVPPATYEKWDRSLEEQARMKLQAFVNEAQKAGVDARELVLTGTPYQAIADAAGDVGCDLVVMGTHGRTGVSRFFLGSVAARVVSTAPCPVMTIHGESAPSQ
jgi:nucleotide-binding universal stress UspA family protein